MISTAATITRTTHHLFGGDTVVFFVGGQEKGSVRVGTVVSHVGDEVKIAAEGAVYLVPRGDVVLR